MAILMVILSTFSALIYQIGVVQLERSYRMGQARQKAQELVEHLPAWAPPKGDLFWEEQPEFLRESFILSKQNLAKSLLLLNAGILLISSFLSYLLAGKTLAPIEEMVADQAQFIADAAHELRTPITAMRTSLEVDLRDKNLKKSGAIQALKDNLADVENLENLSNQLLMLAAYREGQTKLILSQVDLSDLAKVLERKFKGRLEKKNLKFKFKVSKELIFFDASKLEQLLTILIDNAITYSKKGKTIWLTIKINKKCLQITVKDQGVGISEIEQKKLFNRFYRSDQSRTYRDDENKGFGLGLSIAKKIVDLHRGKIELDSQPKKGTTFRVILPL